MRKINGKPLFVEVEGNGPPVLLVHGLGGTTNFYQPQVARLAERHTVIRLDLEGSGRSPLFGRPDIDSWADDINAALDAAGADCAAMVGHSLGALTATTFAARRPERITKLALLGAVRAQSAQAKRATLERAATVREQGMSAIAAGVVESAVSERALAEQPLVAALGRELLCRQDPEGYAASCEALASATEPSYADVQVPVLLVTGEKDSMGRPEVSQDLAMKFPSASTHIIPGVGHWNTLEAPDVVTTTLLDFIAG